ncbi:MAG: acyl-CoA synthetase [Nitrososphaerales archaeon]
MGDKDLRLIERARKHQERIAIIAREGMFTYGQLLEFSAGAASILLDGINDLKETRVAFLTWPGFYYVAIQWGIWRAGGVAVPLSPLHPIPELDYFITNCGAKIVVTHPDFKDILQPIAKARDLRLLTTDIVNGAQSRLPKISMERRAMILYTSGTTSKPKGVVITHRNIQAQVESLVSAWGWMAEDHILNVLPLHHVHGIINVLTCAMWVGAVCEILPRFEANEVWKRFVNNNITLFMAVPTIYEKLIKAWEDAPVEEKKLMSDACRRMRLMVSGSAALPVATLEKWKFISGHVLLERYGMTEIGMALSNALHGERVPGYVGTALPNVEVRLVDENGNPVKDGEPGEIQVKGPTVFLEYWNNPGATKEVFRDGWFSTGDIAVKENGIYRILGRNTIDIIKTGGYKVSALEIEEALRGHPKVKECAVVGVQDSEWGEKVCAALILKEKTGLTFDSFRLWAIERLAPYKVPKEILLVDDLPRNTLGKVVKPEVARLFKNQREIENH